jgi:hypothetical protein
VDKGGRVSGKERGDDVRSDLHDGAGADEVGDLLPLLAVLLKPFEEQSVLLLGPPTWG